MLDKLMLFKLENNVFTVDGVPNDKLYRFMREAVLDNHIPCIKPIGFMIGTPRQEGVLTAIGRNPAVLENMLMIADNLDILIFNCADKAKIVSVETGLPITTDSTFILDMKEVTILSKPKTLVTPLDTCSLVLYVLRSCGYANMDVTFKIIKDRKFFPLCTVFSLNNYIRILPFDGEVHVILENGLDESMLRSLFMKWYSDELNSNIRKEELKWLSKYEQ